MWDARTVLHGFQANSSIRAGIWAKPPSHFLQPTWLNPTGCLLGAPAAMAALSLPWRHSGDSSGVEKALIDSADSTHQTEMETWKERVQTMKRLLIAFFACAIFAACPAFSQSNGMNIVFIPKSSDQDFWVFMREGVDKAVREVGNISLTWRGPSYNDDTDAQISILKAYSRPGVDAIIIVPTDRVRLQEPIRKAAALGIKIVVVDSAVDGNGYQSFITTDNYDAGTLAAKRLSEVLHAQGKVVVFRTVAGSASTEERARGFVEYLKKTSPGMVIVADQYGGGSRGKALHSATRLLGATPRIDGIFAVNESAIDGMLRALRAAGRAGKVKLVGFDATDFLVEGLKNREIDGLVVQDPRQMGYLAIKAAIAAINNVPGTKKTIFTGTAMVTPENYQNQEIKTLLAP
jgi:ribose transport system substrate-binding protein